MRRVCLICTAWASVALVNSTSAWADDTAALIDEGFRRGPGGYFSVAKLLTVWILFLLWVRTTEWVNVDCQLRRDQPVRWNSIVFFSFVSAVILLWIIPWFWLGFLLLLIAYAAPLGTFVWLRNRKVEPHQKVLTREHMRHLVAAMVRKIGFKMSGEKQLAADKGPPVTFTPLGGATDRDNAANLLTARQSPGYVTSREVMAEAITNKVDGLMLEVSAKGCAVRYLLDGEWHRQEPMEKEKADPLIAALKILANLNPKERREKQEGKFAAEFEKQKFLCALTSLGNGAAERVVIELAGKAVKFAKLDEIGMRPKLQEEFKQPLNQDQGLIVISAPLDGGLSSTFDAVLRSTDRFLRDFCAVEAFGAGEHEVENVPATYFNAAKGETPQQVLLALIKKYPNVFVMHDPVNGECLKILCDQVAENRMSIVGARAKDSVEAMLRLLMLKVPVKDFAMAVTASLNARLVRKLCETCKVPYRPSGSLLQQLGFPEGAKVEAFYRPPKPDPKQPKKVCPDCKGVGYKGRTGIFELLVITDAFRQTMIKSPRLDVLRMAAKKTGLRSLQDEGVQLVAQGVTSLEELQRVLKPPATAAAAKTGSSSAKAAADEKQPWEN